MPTAYHSNTFIPKQVQAAKKLAEERGFMNSCSDEAGRLLSVLVGQVKERRILETLECLSMKTKLATYLKTTGNHVRYQVEPIFRGNELVARGVHMQAKSIEDNRLEFNVYIFNVEQGVVINYADGTSKLQ